MKKKPRFHILFAVNKMDNIDPAKEDPNKLITECRDYIQDKGIDNPTLIPVSGESALLFKKALQNIELSEFEEENFGGIYQYFKRKEYSLLDYISVPKFGDMAQQVSVGNKQYNRAQIYAALENTGFPFLERQLDEILVRSLKMSAPKIIMKDKLQ